jgi:molecular chaperone HtpG
MAMNKATASSISSTGSTEHRFQINLNGLIDLLSNHLYTRADVFVRELMQNGTDAIHARMQLQPGHAGSIELRLDDDMHAVTLVDNGIGLTEDEMHRFLAIIGESSKRGEWIGQPQDYIGQFGIGLLACFIVADQIELISRSAASPDAPTLRWRGRPDGTYDIDHVDARSESGTTVRLVAKPESRPLFTADAIAEAAGYYGRILPWPIRVVHLGQVRHINASDRPQAFPWDASHLPPGMRQDFLLDYGRSTLKAEVFDAIPLLSPSGGIDGVAFILERTPVHTAKSRHRVYLKRMLLSDSVENLLPPWAFFVQCVVNCTGLRPTAARNAFSQDAALERTQEELGACLRAYLLQLARREPQRLEKLMSYHHLALKALALEDDEFFKLFAPWFPMETNYGRSTLQAYLERNKRIVCTSNIDEFRQIAQIAAAQGIDVINGGYTYDTEMLARHGELFPDIPVQFVQPSDIGHRLQTLPPEQEARMQGFLKLAQGVLEPFDCAARLKIFEPADLPTLYVMNREAGIGRQIAATEEMADDLWRDVLTQVKPQANSELCFNFGHTLVRRLAQHPDASLVQRVVQILYVQALLMGHYPLSSRELNLMSDGLSGLLEWSIMGMGETTTWH